MSAKYVLLSGEDWETLYVDGKNVCEGHSIERLEMLSLAEKYGFTSGTLRFCEPGPQDMEEANESGAFPPSLDDLIDTDIPEDQQEAPEPLVHVNAFKMSSGEEVLFVGIQTGKLAQMMGASQSAADCLEHNPLGHMISRPYQAVRRSDGGFDLKRWPSIAAFGTCQEIFVPDRDVTFQLLEHEIDPPVLDYYRRVLATTPEGKRAK